METINNVAQAAAKAVWGTPESKEEPVSGKTGNTSKGEPYDAGNMEPRSTTGVTGSDAVKPTEFESTTGDSTTSGDNYTTSSDKYTGTTAATKIAPLEDNYDPAGGVNTSGTEYKPASTSDTNFSSTSTGNADFKSSRYTENTDSTNLAPLEDNYDPAGGVNKTGNTETTANERDISTSGRDTASSGPHKEFGSSLSNKDMSKAQQDVRDPSDPQTDPKEAQIKSNVDDTGSGLDKGDNPDKVDGPGPRPIAEVAKEYGGDAGNAKPEASQKREGAQDDEEGDGPQKTSSGEGSGEKYVKSSGLKADGGDFDATQPGAGKEADRLLESKGVHHEVGKPSATVDDDATNVPAGHEKKSLGEKIKEKLHKPHFKH
ncbi:hypothetical protein CONLIGDRAFT_210312 [Coniochaeta ligniaria NRRL 30616]|uniref:Glycine-rich cell wall structural protein 1 n=1 Tax=Coniochaeta ligniaria NRRL 30616 TaxID=1408157 RepID=A0A1J7JXF7_9PEZI|nr:hypothetical protein CONLIGDRAFT_210312 [Coniochaeta ligniaria NRRL 30616]